MSNGESTAPRNPNPSSAGTQHRNWVFTYNNPTPEYVNGLLALEGDASIKYFRCMPERGESGTLHLQGLVLFKNGRTFPGVKRLLGDAVHLEVMRGTVTQALEYVEKQDSTSALVEFPTYSLEFGSRPPSGAAGQGSRNDILVLYEAAKTGKRGFDLIEACPVSYIKFTRGINEVLTYMDKPRDFKTEVRWYYGPTGTGKSRKAYEEANALGSVYIKDPSTNWWDGYTGQHSVIIDDYRRDMCTFSALLRLFDRYACPVQIKGGYRTFCSKVIFVTTPKNPAETWETRTEEDLAQLTRRIDNVTHFSDFFN